MRASHRTAGVFTGCTLLVGAACAGPAGYASEQEGRTVISDEIVTGDLMTAGRHVRIAAEVEGDVAVAGNDVTIAAPVGGYVMSAGRTVTLQGRVGNDVWAAGERVNINGTIENNAMVAGRTVHLLPGASVGQNARVAGNHVTTEARIEHDLVIGAATAEIGGDIGGTVRASAGHVTVLPGTIVRGDLVVRSPDPPDVSPEAQIMGSVRHEPAQQGGAWASWPWFWLMAFLGLLLLGVVALALSTNWTERVVDVMRTRTGSSLLTGLLIVVVAPLAVLFLLITVIGIPLAVVVLALYIAAVVLSGVFVSYHVGRWLLARRHPPRISPWAAMALGALIVSLGISLPGIGWLVALVVLLAGAGALALERREGYARMRTGTV